MASSSPLECLPDNGENCGETCLIVPKNKTSSMLEIGSENDSQSSGLLIKSDNSAGVNSFTISTHQERSASTMSLYSANAGLSGSDGKLSFVSGVESPRRYVKSIEKFHHRLQVPENDDFPVTDEIVSEEPQQKSESEDHRKVKFVQSSVLKERIKEEFGNRLIGDEENMKTADSSTSGGSCSESRAESNQPDSSSDTRTSTTSQEGGDDKPPLDEMSIDQQDHQCATMSPDIEAPPSPLTVHKFKNLREKFEQYHQEHSFPSPADIRPQSTTESQSADCQVMQFKSEVAVCQSLSKSIQTEPVHNFETEQPTFKDPPSHYTETRSSQTSPQSAPMSESCREWLLTRRAGTISLVDRAIQTYTSMALLLSDNIDAVYMSDYNPNKMLSAQLFTPCGQHVKKFFTAEPFCPRNQIGKKPAVRPVTAPQNVRSLRTAVKNQPHPSTSTETCAQTNRALAPTNSDVTKPDPSVYDMSYDVPDIPVTEKLTAASLASRINPLEPLPIAKMFDYWRLKSAEADAAVLCYDTNNNTAASPTTPYTSQPSSHRTSFSRNSPQNALVEKYSSWWRRKSPNPQIAKPRSSPGVMTNQRSAAMHYGQQPFRSQGSLSSGRRDKISKYLEPAEFEQPNTLTQQGYSGNLQEETIMKEISPPAVSPCTLYIDRYESVKPTNQLVKLWSQVIEDHQSEASSQNRALADGVNRWRANMRSKTADIHPQQATKQEPASDILTQQERPISSEDRQIRTVLRKSADDFDQGFSRSPPVPGPEKISHDLMESARLREEGPKMSRSTSSLIQMENILSFIKHSGMSERGMLDSIQKCLTQRGQVQRTSTRLDNTTILSLPQSLRCVGPTRLPTTQGEGRTHTPVIPPLQLPNSSTSSMYQSPPSPGHKTDDFVPQPSDEPEQLTTAPKFGVMVLPTTLESTRALRLGPQSEELGAADISRIVPPSEVKARVKAKLKFIGKLLPSSGHKRKYSTAPPNYVQSETSSARSDRLEKKKSSRKSFSSYRQSGSSGKVGAYKKLMTPLSNTLPADLNEHMNACSNATPQQDMKHSERAVEDESYGDKCVYFPKRPQRQNQKQIKKNSPKGDKKSPGGSSGYTPASSVRRFAGDFVDTSTVRSQRSLIVTEDDPSVTSADRSCRPKQRPLPAVQSTSRHRRKKKLSAPLPPTSSDENGLADTYIKKAATTQDMKPKELPINKWVDEVTNPDGAWSGSQPSDHFLSGSAGAACSQSSAPSIPPVQSLGPCVTSPHQAVVNISARKSTDVHSSSQSSIHHGITKFMNKIKSSVPFVNARAFN